MNNYQTIEVTAGKPVATVRLNRPEVRNAFNALMIREITRAFEELSADKSVRLILIRGNGKVFCSGADLNWMKEAVSHSEEENYREALELAECFQTIYTCPKPVITIVHGASTGGANGFVAVADIALTTDDAVFSLSEVRSGLVPAVISPYIIKRIGEFPARELMLTARRIHGIEAADRGLVNWHYASEELEEGVNKIVHQILEGGPEALAITRKLIYDVSNNWSFDEAIGKTASIIASIRVSDEGREGMAAFLEKRKPRWSENNTLT